MTVWHLIVAYCFAAPPLFAVMTATTIGGGWSTYGLAIVFGIGISAVGGWMLLLVDGAMWRRHQSKPFRERHILLLYVGSFVWGNVLGFTTEWVTRTFA